MTVQAQLAALRDLLALLQGIPSDSALESLPNETKTTVSNLVFKTSLPPQLPVTVGGLLDLVSAEIRKLENDSKAVLPEAKQSDAEASTPLKPRIEGMRLKARQKLDDSSQKSLKTRTSGPG